MWIVVRTISAETPWLESPGESEAEEEPGALDEPCSIPGIPSIIKHLRLVL